VTSRHFLAVVAIAQGALLVALIILIILNRWFRLRRRARHVDDGDVRESEGLGSACQRNGKQSHKANDRNPHDVSVSLRKPEHKRLPARPLLALCLLGPYDGVVPT